MTQLDRSVAPAIRQLEHFSILQPELHRMRNGMPCMCFRRAMKT